MESLSKESIKNLEEEKSGDNIIEKTSSNIDINDDARENLLKKSKITQYSTAQLLMKTISVSLLNWKYLLFERTKSIFFEILDIYIPVQKGLIIDCITDKSKHDLLYPNFIRAVKFMMIKTIFQIIFQLIEINFIKESYYKFKDTLIENISQKDIEFFDSYKTGELVEKIKNCEKIFQKNIIYQILKDLQSIIKIIYFVYFLLNTNLKISIFSLILVFIKNITEYMNIKISGSFDFSKFDKLDEKYNNHLTDFILNIRLIKSFATEKLELDKIKTTKREMYKTFDNPYITVFEVLDSLSKIGDYFILYYTGTSVISGYLSFGQYTIFDTYFTRFKDEVDLLYLSLRQYKEIFVEWRNFFELYDYKPKIISEKNITLKKENIKGKIDFQNVKFNYPLNPDVKILDNLSFSIEQGKILALVGYSGSGKTTISNLIQRFYDPVDGNILLDDINIKDFNLDSLHRNIGFVSQEPILCDGTIEYNITYGVEKYTKNKLDEICELSLVNKFVKDKKLFPEGLETLVGERGAKVSGGQKQRIAIARAIMKDVKILIFDEATSALDAESENEVQTALDNIIKNKKITTIIIAHRLSTIKNADKILFLNKGKIMESGTHEELLNLNGEYKKLISKQL